MIRATFISLDVTTVFTLQHSPIVFARRAGMIGHNRVILFMALLWVCNGAHHLEASDDMATDNLGESGPSPDEAAKQTEGAATGVQRKMNMGVGDPRTHT